MELKDMTNEQLLAEEDSCQYDDSYPFRETAHGEEILRRLNEADALRKENEKLKAQNILIRGDSAELLAEADAYSFNLSNMNASIAELRKENEVLRKAVDYVASFMSVEDGNEDEYCAACPYVSLNYEDFEMDLNYGLLRRGECENVWRQSLTDVIIRAALTRATRLAKESEASHETTSYDKDDFIGITKIYEEGQ